jgi:hypothetical protein
MGSRAHTLRQLQAWEAEYINHFKFVQATYSEINQFKLALESYAPTVTTDVTPILDANAARNANQAVPVDQAAAHDGLQDDIPQVRRAI